MANGGSYNRNNQRGYSNQQTIPEVVKKSFKVFDYSILIKEKSLEVANAIYSEHSMAKKRLNKNSQIRKFFDDLYAIKNKIDAAESREDAFKENLPMIYLIASKCAYAKGRKHIGEVFYNFIKTNVLSIDTLKDFNEFIAYFEATLGYYRYLNPSEN
jgi:CRISPR-associated protein Csm2